MESTSYLDFDLLIERSGDATYRARLLSSPAGQATGSVTLPFSEIELENYLLRIGRPRRGVRRLESPEMETAKTFGGKLFKSVFSDELLSALRSSLDEAKEQNRGLRIRLRLNDAPELVNLPWEYLYNPSLKRFLSLSVNTPLVRYLEMPERIPPLLVTLPLRILVMISNPSDYSRLNVEQEWSNLESALCGLIERGLVVLDRLESASPMALQYQLRRNEYHIFHFIGHGGFNEQTQDGILLFEDEGNRGRPLSGQYLGTLLHDEGTLRLVVLNACEGGRSGRNDPFAGVAQSVVQQGMPAVIAMQFEITDEAAIAFAREFYTAVAEGFPVDAAMSEARKAIFSLGNDIEWGTPVLYMRAPDGHIFDIPKINQPASIPAQPVKQAEIQSPPASKPILTDVGSAGNAAEVQKRTTTPKPVASTSPPRQAASALQKPGLPGKMNLSRWLLLVGGSLLLGAGLIVAILLTAVILGGGPDKVTPDENADQQALVLEPVLSPTPHQARNAPSVAPSQTPSATRTPQRTPQPTATEATPEEPVDEGASESNIAWVSDDFSSSDGTWSEEALPGSYKLIADGQYVFGLLEAQTYLASTVPVINHPSFISFHITIQALGEGSGSYSVYCRYPETGRYYEIRLLAQDPFVYIYDGGAGAWLVEQQSTSLNTGEFAENDIQILCQPGFIELFINNTLETRVELGSSTRPGSMELRIDTWDSISPDGYKVAFDNIYASNEFYDNFASNVHGWYEEVTPDYSATIENGANILRLHRPNWYIWSHLPVEYPPTTVWFTAATTGVYGSFGVRCNFIDEQNFYEVSFQSLSEDFTFWQVKNGEWIDLLGGEPFIPENLNATGLNNAMQIICRPGLIQLYVNHDAERELRFEDSTTEIGAMALFARTWDELDSNGYQVTFDDVGANE